jgi:hypothetical protein
VFRICGSLNNQIEWETLPGDNMTSPGIIIFVIVLAVATFLIRYFVGKDKVVRYLSEKYPEYSVESIKWTLFGPFAPGKNNIKFEVILLNGNTEVTNAKKLFAVTSFFGGVYISES